MLETETLSCKEGRSERKLHLEWEEEDSRCTRCARVNMLRSDSVIYTLQYRYIDRHPHCPKQSPRQGFCVYSLWKVVPGNTRGSEEFRRKWGSQNRVTQGAQGPRTVGTLWGRQVTHLRTVLLGIKVVPLPPLIGKGQSQSGNVQLSEPALCPDTVGLKVRTLLAGDLRVAPELPDRFCSNGVKACPTK